MVLPIDPRIKFRHLQAFMEVARQKSVNRAAELLHISQPAVTKTIRELEDILAVALLERDGRGIRLTSHGEVFMRYAGATLTALRQAVDSVAKESARTGPPVRVGALPTVSARIMPHAISRFLAEGTGSPVKVVTGENAVLLEQLRMGDLDLVVGRLAAPEKMTGLSFEHLYSERVLLTVRAGHPLLEPGINVFERLGEFPVLMPTRNSVIRPIVEQFLIAHGIPAPVTQIETVSDAFGRAFLRMSDAVWIISEGVVAGDIADGRLVALPIATQETRGPVGLTVRADSVPSLPLTLLTQAIRAEAEAVACG
ncbi:MAG: pca operon transcription factor PcaQ [Proteobacteria bacterium]|nr:pca operon transcription factor PcaQ [Pseudomonadota bacterium]MCA0421773.1 pca operon transcription factor PcaQ [Pseudomonadota bacterium]